MLVNSSHSYPDFGRSSDWNMAGTTRSGCHSSSLANPSIANAPPSSAPSWIAGVSSYAAGLPSSSASSTSPPYPHSPIRARSRVQSRSSSNSRPSMQELGLGRQSGIVDQHQRRAIHSMSTSPPSTTVSRFRSPTVSTTVSPRSSVRDFSLEMAESWAPPDSWSTSVLGPDALTASEEDADPNTLDANALSARLKKKGFRKQKVLAPLQLKHRGKKMAPPTVPFQAPQEMEEEADPGPGLFHPPSFGELRFSHGDERAHQAQARSKLEGERGRLVPVHLQLEDHGLGSPETVDSSMETSDGDGSGTGSSHPWHDKEEDWDRWGYDGIGAGEDRFERFDRRPSKSTNQPSAPAPRRATVVGQQHRGREAGVDSWGGNVAAWARTSGSESISSVTGSVEGPATSNFRRKSIPSSFQHDVPPVPAVPESFQAHETYSSFGPEKGGIARRRKSIVSRFVPNAISKRKSGSGSPTPLASGFTSANASQEFHQPISRKASASNLSKTSAQQRPKVPSDYNFPDSYAWNGVIRAPSPGISGCQASRAPPIGRRKFGSRAI